MADKPNFFDELIAKLKAVTETLGAVAAQMKKNVAIQAANTSRWQEINAKLKAAFPDLERQREALDAAGRSLNRAVAVQRQTNAALAAAPPLAAPPGPVSEPQPAPDLFPMPPPKPGSRPN